MREVAAAAGITHTHLSRWERGERVIAEGTYQALTDALAAFMANRGAA